ncbi:hypothetical protein KEM55_009106 [Ascosphaera atra]|nr:hypothetical protein KEM55_009106 [Ascosphaera atra]
MHCYLPRKYRCPVLFKILLVVEFCFTVAALTLFGIAHPDTYRNKLWQDGSENGLNSSPKKGEYANANYEPYHTPHPWSQFITSYDLVISVLSLFFLLCKAPMFLMNVFYPPLSITTHVVLLVLYGVSAAFQAGPDTSDPKHPQRGAPWYIAKSCGVAKHPSNIGYCRQAKAAFACTIILIHPSAIFAVHLFYAIYSSFPTQETRASHRERREQRQSIAALKEELKSPTLPFPMSPKYYEI